MIRHRSAGTSAAAAYGTAGSTATRLPIRRATAVMLLAAAVLDLTRCGLAPVTAAQAGAAAGPMSVGNWRCPLGIAALSVEALIILLTAGRAWQTRLHASSTAEEGQPAGGRTPESSIPGFSRSR
jgi:hypothetical protein